MNLQKKKRKYNSKGRQERSKETRQKVLMAAKTLFSKKGVSKATIEQIAKLSGVATPTVYALFQSKKGIIRELGQSFVFGDGYQTLVRRSLSEENPVESLRLAAGITISIFEMEMEQMGFLWEASSLSVDFQDQLLKLEAQRFDRQKFILDRLEKQDLLPVGMSVQAAREILWALTGRELFKKFVKEKAWRHEDYKRWLESALVALLVR